MFQNRAAGAVILLISMNILFAVLLSAQTTPGNIGVNLVYDGMFVNMANETNRYYDAASFDADGWPESDFKFVLFDWRPIKEWTDEIDDPEEYRVDYSGTYRCSFKGQAVIEWVEGIWSIENQHYNAFTNITTFDLVIPPPAPHHAVIVWRMTHTRRSPSDAFNTGITDFKAIRPGYDENTTQVFTDEYIRLCKAADFACYRFYTLQNIWQGEPEYPEVTTWSQRKLPSDASQKPMTSMNGKREGLCWEYIIELANLLDRDIWINIHQSCDTDYVTNLAQMLKDNLSPGINIYVENSNEVWSPTWNTHGPYNNALASAHGITFDQSYARRTVELSTIFSSVFGAGEINGRIRIILASQASYIGRSINHLNYINSTFGPPQNFIYATSPALYFGSSNPDGTVADINAGMYTSIDSKADGTTNSRQEHIALAAAYGLPGGCTSYEGGVGLPSGGGLTNLDNQILANRTAEMQNILSYNFKDKWYDLGGGLALQFTIASRYSRYGCWGLTEDPTIPDRNFKFQAMRDMAGSRSDSSDTYPECAPEAFDSSAVTHINTPVSITLKATDIDDDLLTYIVGAPSNGALTGTAPNLTYNPDTDFTGDDSFTFYVNDGNADSTAATVSITVRAVNTAPEANNLAITTDEDTPYNLILTGSDIDNDTLTFTVTANPLYGTLSGTAPSLTYTPDADWNGSDLFTFYANDGDSDSATATVTITVNEINDAPAADNAAVSTNEDTAVLISLTASDTENDTLIFHLATQPSNGTLTGTIPDLIYTPDDNYNGADSFTFYVNDGEFDSVSATVDITINPQNDAPTADFQNVSTPRNTACAITLTGSDLESDPLTFHVDTDPSSGSLSGTAPDLTYTPNTDFSGTDSFTFHVNDGTVDSPEATVTIRVDLVNGFPTANPQTLVTDEDTDLILTLSGTDPEFDTLSYHLDSSPQHGTLNGTVPDLTFTPDSDWHGSDSFTFHVNDGVSNSIPAEVSITVNSINDAPTADTLVFSGNEDSAISVILSGSDPENDSLEYFLNTTPSHGTLTGTLPSLTYTPDADYNGNDNFAFRVYDGEFYSAGALVTITVNPGNDIPVAYNVSAVGKANSDIAITLIGSDIDGDTLTYNCSTPLKGTVTGPGPDIIFTPKAGFSGETSFTYTVNDGTTDSNTATVTIKVKGGGGGGCRPEPEGNERNPQPILGILFMILFAVRRFTRRK